ncbi:MAG: hypothetical protein HYR62_09420 [Actinobacteria bacterium]|nr:hypothetical protein [Actinomycetota bacterium]MBI3688025.1 hypothetical protein [Actinomycetota bacterium]
MTMSHDEVERLAALYESQDTSADLERAELDGSVVSEPMITTSLRLPKPVMDAIRTAADARGMRATALMREWLEQRLAQQGDTGELMVPVSAVMAFLAEAAARANVDRRAS